MALLPSITRKSRKHNNKSGDSARKHDNNAAVSARKHDNNIADFARKHGNTKIYDLVEIPESSRFMLYIITKTVGKTLTATL